MTQHSHDPAQCGLAVEVPSSEDTTRRIRESGELLDALLDHVVIGARGFVSMKPRLGFDGSGSL